jgi:hypothetical protein
MRERLMADPIFAWLDKARELCNRDPEFRKLGSCDARVGVKVDDAAFVVTFEAFECVGVTPVDVESLRDTDFYLDMSREAWRELLTGGTEGCASLVSATVDDPELVRASSPLNALKFDRYHRTLQRFFDRVAALAAPTAA